MNVYQKIAEVMKRVQYLSKDDKVEFKTTNYRAISEEKVTTAVRTAMVEVGLVILPVEQHRERIGQITSVDTKYRIQNIEDPDDFVIVVSSGDGADSQDKGAGKAMTYAYKYMMLRSFSIPTGEDPDKVSSAELDEKEREKYRDAIKRMLFVISGKDKTSASTRYDKDVKPDADDLERLKWHFETIQKEYNRVRSGENQV